MLLSFYRWDTKTQKFGTSHMVTDQYTRVIGIYPPSDLRPCLRSCELALKLKTAFRPGQCYGALNPFLFVYHGKPERKVNSLLRLFLKPRIKFKQNAAHCVFLEPLSRISWPYIYRFISGLSILVHWSIYLYASTTLLLYYCFEIRKCESSNFVVLFQSCFGSSGFLIIFNDFLLFSIFFIAIWFSLSCFFC